MSASDAVAVIVLTSMPDRESALKLADMLVDRRLAACVSVLSECTSVYRWQGKVERSAEVPVMIKTAAASYPRLEAAIRASHPYELPEIASIPVAGGCAAYLDWIAAETSESLQVPPR